MHDSSPASRARRFVLTRPGVRSSGVIPAFFVCALLTPAAASLHASNVPQLGSNDESIVLTGESGKDSPVRTIRFSYSGTKPPEITFLTSDLVGTATTGQLAPRIDRGQVRIASPAASRVAPTGFADFEVSVANLPDHCGAYAGSIEFFNKTNKLGKANKLGTISLAITVTPARSIALETDPKSISDALINGDWLLETTLAGGRYQSASHTIEVPSLPEGAQISSVRYIPLQSTAGDAVFDKTAFEVQVDEGGRGAVIRVNAIGVPPGKYTSHAQLFVAGTDEHILIPIEVSVRTNPWWVLLLILGGVVLGRLAKYMNERGNQIVATKSHLDSFISRATTLDPAVRQVIGPTVNALRQLQAQGNYSELPSALTQAESRLKLTLRAFNLLDWAQQKQRNAEVVNLQETIGDLARSTMLDQLAKRLDDIESRLLAPVQIAPADAQDDVNVQTQGELLPTNASRFRVRLLELTEPVLVAVGGILLAFVGFETLYVNGSSTFGANPVTDYLSAVVWGLSADVAARTISSLGRIAAPGA